MRRIILHPLTIAMCCLAAMFSFKSLIGAQTEGVPRSVDIAVQVLDGRNGKPIPNQRLLVFIGTSSEAAKSHAEHTDLTTDKDGRGTLRLYPNQTQWIQVWTDGRVLCYSDPNQNSLSVNAIMSTGFVTANTCGGVMKDPTPGHLVVFARPASFKEKMKR